MSGLIFGKLEDLPRILESVKIRDAAERYALVYFVCFKHFSSDL